MKIFVLLCTALLLSLAAGCTGQNVKDSKDTVSTIEGLTVETAVPSTVTLATGFTTTVVTAEQTAKTLCRTFCQENIRRGVDLSSGPCIRNPFISPSGWVCDVAHSPREPVDNLPENQCSAYISGEASHFVEVTPDCAFIRAA